MNKGLYVIFEGNDGAGKSTTMKAVSTVLADKLPSTRILTTIHPGSTPLGAHLRKLVKTPEAIAPNIVLDPLSHQILFMADAVNFIKQVLEPELANDSIVLADRSSFVSALVYGLATGLDLASIDRLTQIAVTPKADRLYILSCPWRVGMERIRSRSTSNVDFYDRKPEQFFMTIEKLYNNLATTSIEQSMIVNRCVNLDSIVYVDATKPQTDIVLPIVTDIVKLFKTK